MQAMYTDIQILKDQYNIRFVRAPRLKIFATNEYGDQIKVRRPAGGSLHSIDTHHYRPACKDYGL
jgi:hypothetical protein